MDWNTYREWRLLYVPRIRLSVESGQLLNGTKFWRLVLAINDRQFHLIDRTVPAP